MSKLCGSEISKPSLYIFLALIFCWILLWYLKITIQDFNNDERTSSRQRKEDRIKVYIYQWPDEIIDRWPINYTHERLSLLPYFKDNYGIGPAVNETIGYYHTHQYTLFTIFHEALRHSKYLTTNPDEATHFFIPYDLGMDASTRQSDGALLATNCPKVPAVMKLLQDSPYFARHQGADHILIHSINHMMLYFANKHCHPVYELCLHCTKLSIDVYTSDMYPVLTKFPFLTNQWISIPFPSSFHWNEATIKPAWRMIEEPDFTMQQYFQHRPYALCFLGSTAVTATKQKRLRESLMKACQQPQYAKECLLVPLSSHSSNVVPIPHEEEHPYHRSRFCLIPGGDFPTRKAFLDALLAGCIPITFQLETAQSQWLGHWGGFDMAMESSIYIPRSLAMTNISQTFEHLIALSHDHQFIVKKLLAMAKVGDRMQYNKVMPTAASVDGSQQFHQSTRLSSSPPIDAFEVTIEILRSQMKSRNEEDGS